MGSTTIRVDTATHAELLDLSRRAGATLSETVRDAALALRRARFGEQVRGEFEALANDPDALEGYLADAESTSVPDGVAS